MTPPASLFWTCSLISLFFIIPINEKCKKDKIEIKDFKWNKKKLGYYISNINVILHIISIFWWIWY
jgi:hypothetical protein